MNTRSSPNRQTLNRFELCPFLVLSFNSFLIRLADRAGIEGYDTMPKSVLYEKLTEKYNYDRLIRMEARARKNPESKKSRKRSASFAEEDEKKNGNTTCSSTSSSSDPQNSPSVKVKKVKLNQFDPIMLVPIEKKKKTFKFHRPNGSCVQFNVATLIDYLLTSGDFHDPETRLPFTEEQLKEIDQLAKDNGLEKTSVYDAMKNEHFYKEMKFRRDALLGLERCCGEVITDILDLLENSDPDEAQMQFLMRGECVISFLYFHFERVYLIFFSIRISFFLGLFPPNL
jgi:hypothetical protein